MLRATPTNGVLLIADFDLDRAAREERPGREGVPLAPAQQFIWLASLLRPGGPSVNSASWRVPDDVDLSGLPTAARVLTARHDSLRTAIEVTADGPRQTPIADDDLGNVVLADVRATGLDDGVAAVERASAIVAEPGRTAPWRVGTVTSRGDERDDRYVYLAVNHLAADIASQEVLIEELMALLRDGDTTALDGQAPETSYMEYALQEAASLDRAALRRELAYWRGHLAGADFPPGPGRSLRRRAVDRLADLVERVVWRVTRQRENASSIVLARLLRKGSFPGVGLLGPGSRARVLGGRTYAHLAPELGSELRAFCQRVNGTPFMVFLTVWCQRLGLRLGGRDMIVLAPFANRPRRQLERVVGTFANVVPVRIDCNPDATFIDALASTRRSVLTSLQHQAMPFSAALAISEVRRAYTEDRIVVWLGWNDVAKSEAAAGGSTQVFQAIDSGRADDAALDFDASLTVWWRPAGVRLGVELSSRVWDTLGGEHLARTIVDDLARVIAAPDATLRSSLGGPVSPCAGWL